jgi:Tfp pilus assembly protein PilN
LTTRCINANILILKLYRNWVRRGTSVSDADDRQTGRLRLVAAQQDQRRPGGIVDELLGTLGAGRLAQLLVESVHTQADHLAMAGRADEALALRRYASVIARAAGELSATTKSNAANRRDGCAAMAAPDDAYMENTEHVSAD